MVSHLQMVGKVPREAFLVPADEDAARPRCPEKNIWVHCSQGEVLKITNANGIDRVYPGGIMMLDRLP